MSGQHGTPWLLDRVHKLERQIKDATKELNKISIPAPQCKACKGTNVKRLGFEFKCNSCGVLTPCITADYVRVIRKEIK